MKQKIKTDNEKVKIKLSGIDFTDWKLSNPRAEKGIKQLKDDAVKVYRKFKKKYKRKM